MKPERPLLVLFITLLSNNIILGHTSSTDDDSSDSSDLCPEFFLNLTLALYEGFNVSQETYNMFLYSGHTLNDLGDYQACTNIVTQKYSVINFLTASGLDYSVGFCGPSVCNVNQLQNYTDIILQALSDVTTKYSGKFTVAFVDPDQTGIQTGFWLYFTLVLYGILCLFVIVGTWLKYRERVKKESQDTLASLEDPLGSTLGQNFILNKDNVQDDPLESIQSPELELAKEKSFSQKFFESFDVMENLKSLFSTEEIAGHDQNLNVVNGIRTLAFGWVVYGHTLSLSKTAKNFAYLQIFMKSAWVLLAAAAFYAVDTFFFLSGFFAGFLLLSKLRRMPIGVKNYLLILFHRWIRLWPAYMIVILFFWKISVNLASGPQWYSYVENAQYCSDGAWKNALLMDNVLNAGFPNYCFGGGWYLACDFQMFLLAPFICWIYLRKKNWSLAILAVMFVGSMVLAYIEAYNSGYTYILLPDNQMENSYMLGYYENTVVRMPPYLIGLWLGTMFKEYKAGQKNFFSWLQSSQLISVACGLLGLGLLCFIVFFPRTIQEGYIWSDGFAISWSAFSRPLWAIGVFLSIAPCLVGNLQIVGAFLGNYYFTLVSRLSYTGYLIHLVFLQMVFDGADQIYGLSEATQASIAFAVMLISCGGAVIIYLFVEKPIINIEALLMKRKKN